MADAHQNSITIYDLAKRTQGGKVAIDRIISEYATYLTIGAVLPLAEATDKDEDVGAFIEPWTYNKHSQLTDLDHGPQPTKHDSYARHDPMSYRDAAIEVTQKHYDYGGPSMASLLTQETRLKVRDIALDNEHDIFYGNPAEDERQMLGLYPRFTVLTDAKGIIKAGTDAGKLSPYRCISAGGTGLDKLSSIFLIAPGDTSVCMVYPKESLSGGFRYSKGEFRRTKDSEGGIIDLRDDLFSVQNGLSIRNRAGAIRIANVDYSTDAGIEGTITALYEAVYAMPQELRRNIRVFCATEGIPKLLEYFNAHKYPTSAGSAKPEGIGSDLSIPGVGLFYATDHITTGEDAIA